MNPCWFNFSSLTMLVTGLFTILFVGFTTIVIPSASAATQSSGEITVNVTPSQTRIQIAELISVNVQIFAPIGTHVSFPPVDLSWGEFEVIDSRDDFDIPDSQNPDQRIWTRTYDLETLTTGQLELPSLELQTRSSETSQWSVLKTSPTTINVGSVLEEGSNPFDIRDIKSTVDVEVPRPRSYAWMVWSAAAVLGLTAFGTLAFLFTKRKLWIEARAWALRELGKLQNEISSSHEIKGPNTDSQQTLIGLETILKRYLETQLAAPATKMTTQELVKSVQATNNEAQVLTDILNRCEQVKYAGQNLNPAELNTVILQAKHWIEETEFELANRTSDKQAQQAATNRSPHV